MLPAFIEHPSYIKTHRVLLASDPMCFLVAHGETAHSSAAIAQRYCGVSVKRFIKFSVKTCSSILVMTSALNVLISGIAS